MISDVGPLRVSEVPWTPPPLNPSDPSPRTHGDSRVPDPGWVGFLSTHGTDGPETVTNRYEFGSVHDQNYVLTVSLLGNPRPSGLPIPLGIGEVTTVSGKTTAAPSGNLGKSLITKFTCLVLCFYLLGTFVIRCTFFGQCFLESF